MPGIQLNKPQPEIWKSGNELESLGWSRLQHGLAARRVLQQQCFGNDGGGGNPDPDSGGDDGNGGSDGTEPTELNAASKAYSDAEKAVSAAVEAAREAAATDTPATREAAEKAIEEAREKLSDAVKAAQAAAAAAESPKSLGEATRALTRANSYQAAQESELDSARASFTWLRKKLARYTFANGDVAIPRDGANVATITRIPRTIPSPTVLNTQIANPKAFKSDTFEDVPYSNGKEVFSIADDAESSEEFKVDGYVAQMDASIILAHMAKVNTGLKLTNAGLVIRTGADQEQDLTASQFESDSTDFRRKITAWANDGDGDGNPDTDVAGRNGWDLEIAFDQPQTKSVASGATSWTGNGDFYWRAVVEADEEEQLPTDGDYYASGAFLQPDGYKDLGIYEVWLSNHIGVDTKLEPAPGTQANCRDGSRGFTCPDDDESLYLNYAAYGLFAYTASTNTFRGRGGVGNAGYNGQVGRINTIHFGYSAFANVDGQKTTDIGAAITRGKFRGYTLAYGVRGARNLELSPAVPVETELLRGDVTLTVNIPKGSGEGTLEGTMDNFQRWHKENNYWTAYTENFAVRLSTTASPATINADGTFSGTAAATPSTGLGNSGAGACKGNFYGPRADRTDLEVAGSWSVGTGGPPSQSVKVIFGSFGAKQRPAATPASN